MDPAANLQDKSASLPAGAAPKSSEGPALSDTKRAPIMRQFELIEAVKAYDPTADEALLNRAYVYAMKMHGSQLRASGDPYFAHPIQVAGILTDYKLDTATIVTALLHDVVEDTSATRDDIAEMFGEEVAVLVEGVTKLSRLELQAEHTRQAENLRKFILAISQIINDIYRRTVRKFRLKDWLNPIIAINCLTSWLKQLIIFGSIMNFEMMLFLGLFSYQI